MLIHGSRFRTAMVAMLLCLSFRSANAQDDPSQRPLPLPERGVADLPQHMELLKRLRSLVESQQKNSEQVPKESDTRSRLPELPSPADASSSQPKKSAATSEESPFQPQQLQQFQDALKNLAGRLPPGFVPPDLSSVPPDQLRKAMENPAVQQQMKQMLEQFAKDGVLPKAGESGSQLPVPPQNDGRQNDGRQNDGRQNDGRQNDAIRKSLRKNGSSENPLDRKPSPNTQEEQNSSSEDAQQDPAEGDRSPEVRSPKPEEQNSPASDESVTGESGTAESATPDSANDAPPGSMRSLRSFLKKLAEDAGMKSPEALPEPPSQNERDARTEPDDQVKPAVPKNSSSNDNSSSHKREAAPRRPLRKRETSKPKTAPPEDSSILSTPGANRSPSGQLPGTSPNPLNPPNPSPTPDDLKDSPDVSPSFPNSSVPRPSFSNPPQGLRIDPETARKQLEDLQKTLERMKQLAEESDSGRSSTEELPSSETQLGRSTSNGDDIASDSSSVVPSPSRNNRIANKPDSDNSNGEQLPESLPDVDEFLREQLKDFKLPPNAFPGGNSGNNSANKSFSPGVDPFEDRKSNPNRTPPNVGGSRNSVPHDLYMERPPQPEDMERIKDTLRSGNTTRPGNDPSANGNAESDKPPIDIAKELEQGGFGNTLKKLVDRAKEEAKKPRPPAQNSADAQGIAANAEGSKSAIENAMNGAAEAAKKADPELSKSMAKMLDGLKDDLVKIAKDARFNDPPERSRGDRPMARPSPAESNSMIDSLRKSASEILAGPSRSSNSGRSAASSSSAASTAFNAEFDFTPVLVLAGVLAALAIAFFGLRHVKLRSAHAVELQFAGAPLKPSDINSRADVVRAFHEFAMRSAQSVQSWWTHRTVQRAILEKAPEYQAAVETLANTYEQARYLPVEQELSPEQLESARAALQQCSQKHNNGQS